MKISEKTRKGEKYWFHIHETEAFECHLFPLYPPKTRESSQPSFKSSFNGAARCFCCYALTWGRNPLQNNSQAQFFWEKKWSYCDGWAPTCAPAMEGEGGKGSPGTAGRSWSEHRGQRMRLWLKHVYFAFEFWGKSLFLVGLLSYLPLLCAFLAWWPHFLKLSHGGNPVKPTQNPLLSSHPVSAEVATDSHWLTFECLLFLLAPNTQRLRYKNGNSVVSWVYVNKYSEKWKALSIQ